MVEQADFDASHDIPEFLGQCLVKFTGLGPSTGMVMRKHHASGVVPERGPNNLARVNRDALQGATAKIFNGDQTILDIGE
jgi:hypothetical protein